MTAPDVGAVPSIQKACGSGSGQILTPDPKAFLQDVEAKLRGEGRSRELGERDQGRGGPVSPAAVAVSVCGVAPWCSGRLCSGP